VLLPLQSGREWVTSPISIVVWGWMPFQWVSGIVADSFAGERERHTLEALLATRLSDRAILFGKLLASLLYGFVLTMLILLVSLITVNLVYGRGELILFPLSMALGAMIFSILISGLAAGLGVLVSLRAGSVRQAQQMMSLGLLVLFVPFLAFQFLPPSMATAIHDFFVQMNIAQIVLGVVIVLIVIDLALIGIDIQLFKRSKLILD